MQPVDITHHHMMSNYIWNKPAAEAQTLSPHSQSTELQLERMNFNDVTVLNESLSPEPELKWM